MGSRKTSRSIFHKAGFHLRRIAFEQYAIPKVRDEKISKALLKRYLPPDPVIIDCGAYDGTDSVALAKLFPKGMVHSFEPIDNLFNRLLKNTVSYSNIKCYQLALSDRSGMQDFYVSEGLSDGSSSLLEPVLHLKDHPDTFFKTKIIVNTTALSEWAYQHGITKVNMLWLDMQGFELQMLKAAGNILKTVSVIHTEVSTRETYKNVAQYKEYRKFLEQAGFNVIIEAIPKGWDMGNVLFVRKE